MLLALKEGITYGPVSSRRLGRSLGINLLPPGSKVCTFDCVYCQYGWTKPGVVEGTDEREYPPVELVALAVAKALVALAKPPAFVTFSGHGEATLHPAFGEVVDAVTRVRDRFAPTARTAILSNSSTVTISRVRSALARLDCRIMKLDCGGQGSFRRFNRPGTKVALADVVAGLHDLGGVTLQTLFATGPSGNLGEEDVACWLDAVVAVAPEDVQIYTLDRGYPSRDIAVATRAELETIRDRVRARGISAEVY